MTQKKLVNLFMYSECIASAEEEQLLFRNRCDQKQYEKIIYSYGRMVVKAAMQYKNLNIPFHDLMQEGLLGLMRAITLYDLNYNVRFSTYARWWIKSFIQNFIMDYLFYTKNEVSNNMLTWGNDDLSNEYVDKQLGNLVEFEDEYIENMGFLHRIEWLKDAMKDLSSFEYMVISALFLQKKNLSVHELADTLNMPISKIKTVQAKALRKLKNILATNTIHINTQPMIIDRNE